MPSPPARTAALDGVRALAALSVVCFHAWLYRVGDAPGRRTGIADKVLFEASLGLTCFFVLSGFLLYRPFARAALTGRQPVAVGQYALRRAVRIVPAYYACLLGSLLLYWAVGYSTIVPSAAQLPLFAVFGQNYSMDTVMKINPVTWTLCVEVAFYVLLPVLGLVTFLLGPRRPALQAAILCGLVGSTIAWNALVYETGGSALASKALPTYIGYFAIGMLVAMWVEWRPLRGRHAPLGAAATAALMALGLSCVAGHAYWHETAGSFNSRWILFANLPAAVGLALVIAAAAIGTGPAMSWLGTRLLAGLGLISYGIYLWHLPLILIVRQMGLLPATFAPRLLLVLTLAVGAATLSWILVERPLLRRLAAGRQRGRTLGGRRTSGPALART
jgi:peptidoglycan/LPS O-acetylase OafA/YrhL